MIPALRNEEIPSVADVMSLFSEQEKMLSNLLGQKQHVEDQIAVIHEHIARFLGSFFFFLFLM